MREIAAEITGGAGFSFDKDAVITLEVGMLSAGDICSLVGKRVRVVIEDECPTGCCVDSFGVPAPCGLNVGTPEQVAPLPEGAFSVLIDLGGEPETWHERPPLL